jgi:glucose-1-phosphate cytidylyltransferase
MKAVILAGGRGTRLSEETAIRPKPMVEIGGRPIIWHIMKMYGAHGITDFILCLGYKGYMLKEYFSNYILHMSDVTVDMRGNHIEIHEQNVEPWRVTLIDTGDDTMTGGRLKRARRFLEDGADFCMTYGDGVGDIDISALVSFHRSKGVLATLTATRPPGRFGTLDMTQDGMVASVAEKPVGGGGWINGGFFVLSPRVIELVDGDHTVWERGPMERLAESGQLAAYRHEGFWQPMDTLREKTVLNELWNSTRAPWRMW